MSFPENRKQFSFFQMTYIEEEELTSTAFDLSFTGTWYEIMEEVLITSLS